MHMSDMLTHLNMGAKSGAACWAVMVFLNTAVQQGPRELPRRIRSTGSKWTSSETRRVVVGGARQFARMHARPRAVLCALPR